MISLNNFPKNLLTSGGLVLNKQDQILLIFRKNKWDLPKGKIDFNESLEDAALREVVEETGIDLNFLSISKPLLSTPYKSYLGKLKVNKRVIWYLMKYDSYDLSVFPQHEECIEDIRWVNISEIDQYLSNSRKYVNSVFDFVFKHQEIVI